MPCASRSGWGWPAGGSASPTRAIHGCSIYTGRHVGAERLAAEACRIEIEHLGKPIGKQDQYIGVYDGLQYLRLKPEGTIFVDPIICLAETRNELQRSLLLLYTGVTREADGILREQRINAQHDSACRALLAEMVELARELRVSLYHNDLAGFGGILDRGWRLKNQLSAGVSNPTITDWYEAALEAGATGGKICGAGRGGFLLLYAPPQRHADVKRALPTLRPVPFRLELQGSKIIYMEENGS